MDTLAQKPDTTLTEPCDITEFLDAPDLPAIRCDIQDFMHTRYDLVFRVWRWMRQAMRSMHHRFSLIPVG
jgi:hypothetical protein